MTKYVALYCRLSPRPDGSYEGVDLQEKWGRAYAAEKWPGTPVRVYADAGISAANGDHRPEFARLRADLEAGLIADIWSVEQSRTERTEIGWFEFAAELDAAGIAELHTNRDGVVRVRDEVAGIKAVLAAAEVRKLTRRTNDRLAELAAEGRPSGAIVFGYRHALDAEGKKTLEIIPEQAQAIRDAAGWVLAGWSLSRIAAELTKRGIRGARGGQIHGWTVRTMLTNRPPAGLRVYRAAVAGTGVWEPILDEETWHAVRNKLSAPRVVTRVDGDTYPVDRTNARSTGRRYLLTGGVATCGICGAQMIASDRRVRNGRKPYYLCSPRHGGQACVGILGLELEAFVVGELLDELDKPEFIEALAVDDHAAARDGIAAELRGLDNQRHDLAAMWAATELTAEEWRAARGGLDKRERQLRVDLAALPPPAVRIKPGLIRAGWDAMNLDERREIIGMFVARVTVMRAKPGTRAFDPGRVSIDWRGESRSQ